MSGKADNSTVPAEEMRSLPVLALRVVAGAPPAHRITVLVAAVVVLSLVYVNRASFRSSGV
jgi:hypothetical protein